MLKKISMILLSMVMCLVLTVGSFASEVPDPSEIIFDTENITHEKTGPGTITLHVPVMVKQANSNESGIETYANWFEDKVDVTLTGTQDGTIYRVIATAYNNGFVFDRLDYLKVTCRTWDSGNAVTGNRKDDKYKVLKFGYVSVSVLPTKSRRVNKCGVQVYLQDGTASNTFTYEVSGDELFG